MYNLNNGKSNAIADDQSAAPSPASKRNILLMSQTSKQGTPKRLNFDSNSLLLNTTTPTEESTIKSQAQLAKIQAEDEIIDQYLKAPPPQPQLPAQEKEPEKPSSEPVASTSNGVFKVPAQPPAASESDFESESDFSATLNNPVLFLNNLKVFIKGFDTESHELLVNDCQIAGAEVIENDNYKGTVDFLILPVDAVTKDGIHVKAKTTVNHNWLVSF